MNTTYVAIIASLILASTAVTPGQAGHSKESEAEEQTQDPDAVRCKQTTVVGSRIPVRICRTNAEWEAEQRAMIEARRSNGGAGSRCGESGRC